jgi:hypothetical protein
VTEFKKCANNLCERRVKTSVAFCCYPCHRAHDKGYEIHESGILGHADSCNERHKERGDYQLMVDG